MRAKQAIPTKAALAPPRAMSSGTINALKAIPRSRIDSIKANAQTITSRGVERCSSVWAATLCTVRAAPTSTSSSTATSTVETNASAPRARPPMRVAAARGSASRRPANSTATAAPSRPPAPKAALR